MYLGYMKRGAQFMLMFAASAYLGFVLMSGRAFGVLGAFFFVLLPVIWLYQIFDSMHTITQLRKLEIEFPEDDSFFIPGFTNVTNLNALSVFKKRKVTKGLAVVLVGMGVYSLFTNILNGVFNLSGASWHIYNTIMSYVPAVIISLVLIFVGVKLLVGKGGNDNEDGGEE